MESLDRSRGPRLRRALVGLSVVAVILPVTAGGGVPLGAARGGFMLQSPTQTSGAASSSSAASVSVPAPTFFPNVKLPCSPDLAGQVTGCGQLLEPEVTSGPDGTIYVTAQEGVPGGVNAWRRDPGTYEYKQLSKADANEPLTSNTGLALGGGDNDLAVTTDGRVVVASLDLLTAPVSYSTDRGNTWTKVELANGLPNVDRMWLTTVGDKTIYYAYHDNQISQIWLVKSTDGGATWSTPTPVIPADRLPQAGSLQANAGNVQGDIVADPDGRVIIPYLSPKDVTGNAAPMGKPDSMYVAVTDTDGANPVVHPVHEGDVDIQGLFPAIAVDKAGNLYATYTDKHSVFLAISRDHGVTWSAPSKISTGKGNTSTVFPFIIAGSEGRVALAWFGSTAPSNDDAAAKWVVYFAQSIDALSKTPHWTQVIASDHIVHDTSICLQGIACDATGGNRDLAEVVQMGLTKDGRVIISYPDTSATSVGGWSFLAEQRFGPGLYADVAPTPPPLQPENKKPGGIINGLVRKLGTLPFFFTGEGAGTGVNDPSGNEIDQPGDVGALDAKRGDAGHVASANLWTTNFGAIPIAFESTPLAANEIFGGKLTLTTYLAEATGLVANNDVTIKLLDLSPAAGAKPQEIGSGGAGYIAGVDATEGKYVFTIQKPFEVLKGHRIRAELNFACACSTTMRFYYGDTVHPSGFTIDSFARVVGQAPAVVPKPKPRVVRVPLAATGVGSSYLLGILALVAAVALGGSLAKRRG